ncbi:MAG TPA: hypothetical protein DEG42_05320 [Acholeplasmataceae bacterium]|nr:MAG: hypothetical protein A2102_03365 [Tenericutes bacterium GWF2_38_8]HBY65780.1 hypothetical protein [Acholeplasmataceae bacterium]
MDIFISLLSKNKFELQTVEDIMLVCENTLLQKATILTVNDAVKQYSILSFSIDDIFWGYDYGILYSIIDFAEKIFTMKNLKAVDLIMDTKDNKNNIHDYIEKPNQRHMIKVLITPEELEFGTTFYRSNLCKVYFNISDDEWMNSLMNHKIEPMVNTDNESYKLDISLMSHVEFTHVQIKQISCIYREVFNSPILLTEYVYDEVEPTHYELSILVKNIKTDDIKDLKTIYQLINATEIVFTRLSDMELDVISNVYECYSHVEKYINDEKNLVQHGIFITKKNIEPEKLFYSSNICNVIFNIDKTIWA